MGLLKKIDSGISIAIKNDKIFTRPGIAPGAWLMMILPIAVILTSVIMPVSEIYRICAVYSFNLLLNSMLLLYHMKSRRTILVIKSIELSCLVPVVVSSPLYLFHGLDVFYSLCYSVSNCVIYFEILPLILKSFPKSFSFGEACVVSQASALFIHGTFIRFSQILVTSPASGDLLIATTIIQVTVISVLLLNVIPRTWSHGRQYALMLLLLTLAVPVLNSLLGFNSIYWVLEFLYKINRLRLICGWAVCSGFAWGMVVAQIRSQRKANTVTRKSFHLLAVIVYTSGIISDPLLLYFASGIVLSIFLLIEFIRVRNLAPFADALQRGFNMYADEKDAGGVALTPIYLLIGCSVPLWLLPEVEGPDFILPLLAGVLSVGIGDSCASVIGKNFGRQKWSGSSKTIEGSIACAVGQVTALLVLTSLGHIPTTSISVVHLAKPAVAVCMVSLIEAKTDQIDNLVLPLVTYILLLL